MKKRSFKGFLLPATGCMALIVSLIMITTSVLLTDSEPSIPVFNQVRSIVNPVMNTLQKNYSLVSQYAAFKTLLDPELSVSGLELQVIDTESNLVFDSTKDSNLFKITKVNLSQMVHYDMAFMKDRPGYVTFAFPVMIDGLHAADAVFAMPGSSFGTQPAAGLPGLLFPSLALFFIGLLLLLMSIRNLRHDYVKPVEKLCMAIPQLIKGNLETSLESSETTEVGELTRSLDLMRLELKDSLERKDRLEKERKELVASISHEIKTPLASVKAYAEGLRDGLARDPEAVSQYTGVILSKTDGLIKLVNDLMDHSLQELGGLSVNLREHYSRDLLNRMLDPIRLRFANSQISLEIGEIPDVLIRADALRIEQVLVNLIRNAEKYAPEGGKIMVGAVIEDDCLLVSVSDNGTGIPSDELPFVFERHWRGKKASESQIEGAGLGLSICKYIVERHGGVIFAESVPGAGSRFRFTIPKI